MCVCADLSKMRRPLPNCPVSHKTSNSDELAMRELNAATLLSVYNEMNTLHDVYLVLGKLG